MQRKGRSGVSRLICMRSNPRPVTTVGCGERGRLGPARVPATSAAAAGLGGGPRAPSARARNNRGPSGGPPRSGVKPRFLQRPTHSQTLGLMGPRRRLSAARPCPPATQELGGQVGDPPLAPARACLAVHFTRNTLRAVQPQTVPPATTRPRPQRDPSCIRTGTVAPPAEQTGGPPALSQSPVTGR